MKYFIVLIMLLLSTIGWSQSLQFLFRGKVENIDLDKSEGGVKISMVQSGASVSSATSSSNGKYTLKGSVDYSKPFDVVFSKSGFVSKKVVFDFSSLNEEDTPASAEFQPIESLDMDLFKERENVDFSFLDTEPVAKFEWNERKVQVRLDGTLVNRMRAKIDALLNEAENEAAQLEADYLAAIQAGDDAFTKKEYESALSSFEEALGYKPNEKYPADKIIELDALIKAQKNEELAEKQANQEYYNLIEAADNLRDDGNLEKASSTYKEASAKRPGEQYPKDQIAAIQVQLDEKNKALADEEVYKLAIKTADIFLKQNSLRPAKEKYEEASKLKPEEAYPKDKLKEIEDKMAALEEQEAKKKKYSDAITAGDIAYDAEDFQGAKDKYTEALTFESSSTYAKGRIAMCDEALAGSKAEEERLARIEELLEKGNAELNGENYEGAIASFSEVLTLDDKNAEATTKLAEAQLKLEELANQAESEKQYTALIAEGDQANTAKNLEDALAKYEAAKAINDTPEVNEKIAGVQDAINTAKSEADKEATYNALIADAEAKFGADDLQAAIDKYTEATTLDPSKPEPANRIVEIQTILDERAANQAKNDQFATLMKEGSDLMAANDLENAKAKFQEASSVDATSTEPQVKIDEIDALIAQNESDQEKQEQFTALMKEGSDLMASNDLDNAKSKFQEAAAVDPSKS
jgi:tetratricopeptide (TPR) repeat protein